MEFENNQVTQDDSMDRMAAMSRNKTITPINDVVVPDERSDNQVVVSHETSGAIANVDTDTESTLKDSPATFAGSSASKSLTLPIAIALFATIVGIVFATYMFLR